MARFEPVMDVIDSLCLRSGDPLRHKKGLYADVANEVWDDMNETTLRIAKKIKMPVRHEKHLNKRTNSIDLECDFKRISSINVMDECGVQYPVYRNMQVNDDIVEIPAEKNCACEHNCGYKLCNTIKGYEVVQSTVSDTKPDGTPVSFNAISRIAVDKNGIVYKEFQYIKRIYTNNVWTDTILFTETQKLCECEVDHNGCLCDTPKNINNVCDSCGIRDFNNNICHGGTANCPPAPGCDTWVYYCDSKMDWFSVQCGCEPCGFGRGRSNVYNIGETGKRIVFPASFGFEKVIVRSYEDISLANLMIPYYAKQTYMTGLQAFAYEHNPDQFKFGDAMMQRYSRQKWGLFLDLQRMRIKELGQIIAPAARVPSYIDHRQDIWYGFF